MQARLNAIIADMAEQRNILGNRCASIAGELAAAREEIAALKAQLEKPKRQPPMRRAAAAAASTPTSGDK